MKICENCRNQKQTPYIDFSAQLYLVDDGNKIEENIINILRRIANDVADGNEDKIGIIVVLGDFSQPRQCVAGLVQMKPKQNPIKSPIMIDTDEGARAIRLFSKFPYDGAVIINKTGQIIGAGVYLVVDQPMVCVPDGCGTRHKSAASFSFHNDVISVLTLSEETNIIRIWKNGKQEIIETNRKGDDSE